MSFFTLSTGEQAKSQSTAEVSTGGGFDPIPSGTIVLAQVDEAKWDNYNGEDYINVKWQVVGKEYTGRIIFQKLHVEDADAKKADRSIQMLLAIDFNSNKQLAKTGAKPTNESLATLCNKPMGLSLDVWEIEKEDGTVASGNWVTMIASKEEAGRILKERGGNPKAEPKPAPVKTAPATSPTTQPVVDDDLPF